MVDYFQRIGKNVTEMILERATAQAVLAMRASSKMLNGLADGNRLWIKLVRRDFGFELAANEDAMQVYKDEHDANRNCPIELMYLADHKDVQYLIAAFLKTPALVSCAIRRGWTASTFISHHASSAYLEIYPLLLSDPKLTHRDLEHALFEAAYERAPEIAKLILADPRFMELTDSQVMWELIAEWGLVEIAKLFIDDAKIDLRDSLEYAVGHAQLELTQMLLDAGCRPTEETLRVAEEDCGWSANGDEIFRLIKKYA
jgi:hypothetical protein